jgi:hypothetical protein
MIITQTPFYLYKSKTIEIMRKLNSIIGLILIGTLMLSCSSTVQVTDSWKDIKTTTMKDKNVMVMSKTNNDIVRQQFEVDMVESLLSKDIKSIESYKIFPKVDLEEKLSNQELEEIKQDLIQSGIEIVLITSVRDVREYTKTTTTGTSGYYITTSPVYYRRGFYGGFYRHYNTVYMDYGPSEVITQKGKKYILETLVYDLTLPEDHQLLSVVTTTVDNPETLGTTSKDFSKKVVKELVK